MTYLVDATVLSELTKPAPDASVGHWLRAHAADLVIDPVILGELRFGILLLNRGHKRAALERWFDEGVATLPCVPWDTQTALAWAALLARLRRAGHAMPVKDSLVAATALTHGFTVVTRNEADFKKAGLRVMNPFRSSGVK